ncbi:MAG: Na(+)-translocating NADH-quinone reductase subunit C [Planctomycetota bacterium]
MAFSNKYIIFFAVVVCLVCSLAVSALAVALKEQQEANKRTDQYENVLRVAGLLGATEKKSGPEVLALMESKVRSFVIDRKSGEVDPSIAPADFDQRKAARSETTSEAVSFDAARRAQIKRLPEKLLVYEVTEPGKESYILPISGNGLWSTLYGYLCVAKDAQTVRGLTYYEHGETPGLGGEVDNPGWKQLWPGKQIYDASGQPQLEVVKGTAGNDHQVDGLSGATITSNGVSAMLDVWLGDNGFKPFLDKMRR